MRGQEFDTDNTSSYKAEKRTFCEEEGLRSWTDMSYFRKSLSMR